MPTLTVYISDDLYEQVRKEGKKKASKTVQAALKLFFSKKGGAPS